MIVESRGDGAHPGAPSRDIAHPPEADGADFVNPCSNPNCHIRHGKHHLPRPSGRGNESPPTIFLVGFSPRSESHFTSHQDSVGVQVHVTRFANLVIAIGRAPTGRHNARVEAKPRPTITTDAGSPEGVKSLPIFGDEWQNCWVSVPKSVNSPVNRSR
jgi:hypothetical protein